MNIKIHYFDFPSFVGSFGVVLLCIGAWVVSGYLDPDTGLLAQILNVVFGVVMVCSAIDMVRIAGAGVAVRDGFVITGKLPGGGRDGFDVGDLRAVRVLCRDGKPMDGRTRAVRHAVVEFELHTGKQKRVEVQRITQKQYEKTVSVLLTAPSKDIRPRGVKH